MAARADIALPGGELRVRGPGVTVIPPSFDEVAVKGASLGVAVFVGYAEEAGPVDLSSEDHIAGALTLPSWGFLRRALVSFFRNGGGRCKVVGLTADTLHTPEAVIGGGLPGRRRGLSAVDVGDEVELVVAPDLFLAPPGLPAPGLSQVVAAHRAILAFCAGVRRESQGGYFAVLDTPPGLSERQAILYARQLRASGLAEFGALYHPWPRVDDRQGGLASIPPSGAVAGAFAHLSALAPGEDVSPDRGPHLTPANRALVGAIDCERALSRADAYRLLDEGINPLVPWAGRGLVIWGARTISDDADRNHVTVRRILSYVRRSLAAGTSWAVFEPNTPTLWLRLTAYVQEFLQRLWSAGLLVGGTAEAAFRVQCDAVVNPPKERDAGRLNILVAVRPTRSLEQVVIRIAHQSASTASNAAGEK